MTDPDVCILPPDVCILPPGYRGSADRPDAQYFTYGRCRSGKRWFWVVSSLRWDVSDEEHYGYADSEAAATSAATAKLYEVARAQGIAITAHFNAGRAQRTLQELNKVKRASRPAPDTTETKIAEYLYGWSTWFSDIDSTQHASFKRFRITKKTAKRVFYLRDGERIDEHGEPIDYGGIRDLTYSDDETGFVDRQKLEQDGRVHNYARHWTARDYELFISLEAMLAACRPAADDEPTPDLVALKQAMADAHPDRGGSNAAFIAARQAYVAARRRERASHV